MAEKIGRKISRDSAELPSLYLTSWRLVVVTFSLCLGTFLMALDINIITVAIPEITTVFNSLDDVAWYSSGYLLTVTAFQPTVGSLYKYFNVRWVYLIHVVIFEVGSVICAAAPSSAAFIVGRAVAGLGAAGLLQGALAIIGYIVELEKRPMFMGIVISVFGLSVCVGPVMGGAFTSNVSWRWCFWINLPIGAAVIVLLVLFLRLNVPEDEMRALNLRSKLRKLDFGSTILFVGAICCLVLAVQWGGQTKPWNSPTIIGLFIGFGLISVPFAYLQYSRGDDALIPLRVLRQRSILAGSSLLFFVGMLLYTYTYFLPFYFQAVQGASPIASGVRIIPLVLAQVVITLIIGGLVTTWGHYVPYMIVGMLVSIPGCVLITRIDTQSTTVQWAAPLVVAGLGYGAAMQLPYTAVQVVLAPSDASTGNAILVFTNQLGGIVAVPIAQALFLNLLRDRLEAIATPAVDPSAVLSAGGSPASLEALANGSAQLLDILKNAYSDALHGPFILALAAACAGTVCVAGMEWRVLKTKQGAGAGGKKKKVDDAESGPGSIKRSSEVELVETTTRNTE